MKLLLREVVPLVLLAFVLAGCSPATSALGPEGTVEAAVDAAEALVGSYSVEYRTTKSDQASITDETVVRDGEVTGSCSGNQCDLEFTTELKAPDGSTLSGTTALTFDGTTYRGTQTSMFSCDGLSSLTTVENGLAYTSETTITPSDTVVVDGGAVVKSFEIVTVEHNDITAAGRDAGCLKINFSGPDPYVSNATTVGVATRQQ